MKQGEPLARAVFPLAHAGFAAACGHLALRRGPARSPPAWAWAALGGLLPDLLDKPLGFLLLGGAETRLVGHTLLFALAVLAAGWALHRSAAGPVALLGWGCLTHLLLDLPRPATVLWPALGAFPIRGFGELDPLASLAATPALAVGELAGLLVLALLTSDLRRRARRDGRAGPPTPR